MARKQKLILLHSTEKKAPSAGFLEAGELAIQNNAEEAALYIAQGEQGVAKFIDEEAVISIAADAANSIADVVGTRFTSANTVADEIDVIDAKTAADIKMSGDADAKSIAEEIAEVKASVGVTKFGEATGDIALADASEDEGAVNFVMEGNTLKASVVLGEYDEAGAADEAFSAATADTAAQIAALKLDETYAVKAVEDRVDALEAISAETRIAGLEAISADTRLEALEAISGASHTHENKTVLDGITAEQVEAWDNAKDEAIAAASSYTDTALEDYATSADTFMAIEAAKGALADYATSADTVAAIEAVDAKFADYATSADTVAAIEAVDAKFTAVSADTRLSALEAISAESRLVAVEEVVNDLENNFAGKDYEGYVDTLIGEDADKSVRAIANEEAEAAMIAVISGAPEAFDTLKEIADWIGTGDVENTTAAQMVTDIAALKGISADTRIADLEADAHTHENKDVLDGISAEQVEAWDAAVEVATGVTEAIATAKSEAIAAASAYTDSAIAAISADSRLEVLEDFVDVENWEEGVTLPDLFSAVQENIDALEAISADTRLEALEAISGASHTHENKTVLDGITAEQVEAWDNAKDEAIAAASSYTDTALEAYATSADTFMAIEAAKGALADYATSADTVAAIEAVDAKFADYATSADTVAAIEAVDAKFTDFIKGVEITNASGVTSAMTEQVVTFDFSTFVLDCGTYE